MIGETGKDGEVLGGEGLKEVIMSSIIGGGERGVSIPVTGNE